MHLEENEKNAISFSKMAGEGNPQQAIELFVGKEYIQHNFDVAYGAQDCIEYFNRMQSGYQEKSIESVRCIADGTITGKKEYISRAEAYRYKFSCHTFEIHDEIYEKDKACVSYTASKEDFVLHVSEWYFPGNNLTKKIVACNTREGKICEERKLTEPN